MEGHRGAATLRLALAQFKPAKAEVEANLDRIRERISESSDAVDLLVFPECALSGYFLEGGVAEVALSSEALAERLGRPPVGAPDVVVGFYERWRHRLYNAVAHFTPVGDRWQIVHVHRKMFLPTYGVFDEDRFVEAGAALTAYSSRFGRMGLLICEEAWHSLPGAVLAVGGAELILIVSASPARDFGAGSGRPGNLERWEALAPALAAEHGVFVAVAQLVGSEGGKFFAGGSLVIGPDGVVLERGPLMEEGLVRADLDGSAIDRVRFDAPLLGDLERALPHLQRSLERAFREGAAEGAPALAIRLQGGGVRASGAPDPADASMLDLDLDLVEHTLVEFIRDEVVRRRGFERVVVGVSGGVDSAVSLFLAARALGAENVHGFRLPYRTSSQDSLDHARLALEAVGAPERTIEITGPVDAYIEAFEPEISPLRRGNVCARLRAVTLFDQSAKLGALPLGTGNKSERLLGYYTWHADDSPPINPLGDLFKTQVWALARHLGVPGVIVDKPASADLVIGVHDEDELGVAYPEADRILFWLLKGYTEEELVRAGFHAGAVSLVVRRLDGTHWKRELPTVAVLSSSAIGEFYLRPVDY
ncbi:MAG: NAD(+) synthase [Gemmatimonadota bacterium]